MAVESAHGQPHLGSSGYCVCDCEECVREDGFRRGCICPECVCNV